MSREPQNAPDKTIWDADKDAATVLEALMIYMPYDSSRREAVIDALNRLHEGALAWETN